MIDLGAAARCEVVPAHSGAIWSLASLPDQSGAYPFAIPVHNQ